MFLGRKLQVVCVKVKLILVFAGCVLRIDDDYSELGVLVFSDEFLALPFIVTGLGFFKELNFLAFCMMNPFLNLGMGWRRKNAYED
jgi:hypothetical protein